mmetsp:Transcript_10645/g.20402  ORF Transcript_10645/g.20402 Transcript_10645/m.20402 type:complete len:222 (+) Transcript_10645:593-1258(+)
MTVSRNQIKPSTGSLSILSSVGQSHLWRRTRDGPVSGTALCGFIIVMFCNSKMEENYPPPYDRSVGKKIHSPAHAHREFQHYTHLVSRKYHMASAFALASISPIFSLRRSVMNFRMFGFFSSSRNPRNTTVLALGSLPLTVARVRNFDVGSPFSFSIDLSRNCLHTGASSFAHVAIPWARALLSLSYADAADAILASAAVARLRTGICLIIDVERPQRIAG